MVPFLQRRRPAPVRPLLAGAALCLLLPGGLRGQSPSAPDCNVRAFGAKGDGRALDTAAINDAIAAAAAGGGGRVILPAGTYLSASVELRSNVTLYLGPGATLEAVDEKIAPYNLPEENVGGGPYQDYGHSHWKNSLLWGIGLHDVAITGPGRIYGKGLNSGHDPRTGRYRDGPPGCGNKAIALKECRNVILRDFSILHGGHFGILATGVENLTIDDLKIDTNRDGMDIDCCLNVRVTGCSVNSPWDDGICLKASYALGALRPCSNITISDCYVSGNYDEGSLLDGTFRRSDPAYHSYRTGRIKLGTESNGDFKNIAITNCVFDDCQGLAIESVDGSHIEDVAISNITMRHVASAPIFIRLGSRRRGPGSPPVGSIRRVTISNLVASDADWRLGSVISGIPGHDVEDVHLSNLRVAQQGGGDAARRVFTPPEEEARYPEPGMFGPMPSYGFFFRHAAGIEMSHVTVTFDRDEPRPAVVLDDVREATFDHLNLQAPVGGAPRIRLRQVSDFSVTESRDLPDAKRPGLTATGSL